jgi:hypothetical protein
LDKRNTVNNFQGDFTISNIQNSQIAIGNNITQKQNLSINDIHELTDNLLKFQEHLTLLNIPSEDIEAVNEDLKIAIDEAKKDKPLISKIKDKFESAIDVIKKTDGAINLISDWEVTSKIVSLLGKAGYLIHLSGML